MSRIACSPAAPSIACCCGTTTPTGGLTPLGHRLGLVDEPRWQRLAAEAGGDRAGLRSCWKRRACEGLSAGPVACGGPRRPGKTWSGGCRHWRQVAPEVARQVTYDAKYAGYVARQQIEIDRQQRLAARRIPADFDFHGGRAPAGGGAGEVLPRSAGRSGPGQPDQRHYAGRPGRVDGAIGRGKAEGGRRKGEGKDDRSMMEAPVAGSPLRSPVYSALSPPPSPFVFSLPPSSFRLPPSSFPLPPSSSFSRSVQFLRCWRTGDTTL